MRSFHWFYFGRDITIPKNLFEIIPGEEPIGLHHVGLMETLESKLERAHTFVKEKLSIGTDKIRRLYGA